MAVDPRARFLNLVAMAFFASAVAAIALFFCPIRREPFFLVLGMAGTLFLIVLLVRLPGHLRAGEPGVLMRDCGLALLCVNMIVQAVQSGWPVKYSTSLSFLGVALWLAGVVLP